MNLLLGRQHIICHGTNHIPTPQELVEADPRIILTGSIQDYPYNPRDRWTVNDSFVLAAEWENIHTIQSATLRDGIAALTLSSHQVDGWNCEMREILEKYNHEIYVGNLVDVSPGAGKVYYDTYANGLGWEDRYIKKDGKKIPIKPELDLLKNYVDLMRYRLIVHDAKWKTTHYAFDSIEEAIEKWLSLYKKNDVLHNIAQCVDSITDEEARMKFKESYATQGFLNTFWVPYING